MRILGIIAEYNPFHNGHAHHIERARALSGCDCVVAAMGGSFSQRGEAMLLDKWTRAQMALECGADLVVEMPVSFATATADRFALGGVETLHALGADALSFGCESDDLALLSRLAQLRDDEPDALRRAIRERLSEGKSHPRARAEALSAYLGTDDPALFGPNAALAVEYLRANRALNRPMAVYPVRRTSDYHGASLAGHASASAIRSALKRGETDAALQAMPEPAARLLRTCLPDGIADIDRLDALILHRLRLMSADALGALPGMAEGLEARLFACAARAHSRQALIEMVKCKRYTYARISRALIHALLGITADGLMSNPRPTYLRVLGFRRDRRALIARIARTASLPLITGATALKADPTFLIETRATDLWGLATDRPALRRAGRDYTQRLVTV